MARIDFSLDLPFDSYYCVLWFHTDYYGFDTLLNLSLTLNLVSNSLFYLIFVLLFILFS